MAFPNNRPQAFQQSLPSGFRLGNVSDEEIKNRPAIHRPTIGKAAYTIEGDNE
jgi:hypothetical protein